MRNNDNRDYFHEREQALRGLEPARMTVGDVCTLAVLVFMAAMCLVGACTGCSGPTEYADGLEYDVLPIGTAEQAVTYTIPNGFGSCSGTCIGDNYPSGDCVHMPESSRNYDIDRPCVHPTGKTLAIEDGTFGGASGPYIGVIYHAVEEINTQLSSRGWRLNFVPAGQRINTRLRYWPVGAPGFPGGQLAAGSNKCAISSDVPRQTMYDCDLYNTWLHSSELDRLCREFGMGDLSTQSGCYDLHKNVIKHELYHMMGLGHSGAGTTAGCGPYTPDIMCHGMRSNPWNLVGSLPMTKLSAAQLDDLATFRRH